MHKKLAYSEFDPLKDVSILHRTEIGTLIRVRLSGYIAPSSSSGSSINSSSSSSGLEPVPAILTSPPLDTTFLLDLILYGSNVFPSGARNIRVGSRIAAGVKDSGKPSWARVVCEPGAIIKMCSSRKGGIVSAIELRYTYGGAYDAGQVFECRP